MLKHHKRRSSFFGDTIVEADGKYWNRTCNCANRYHLKCVIFAPEGFSEEKYQLCALGADIKRTPKDEGVIGAQTKARSYAQEYGAVYMNQFETEHNPRHIRIR